MPRHRPAPADGRLPTQDLHILLAVLESPKHGYAIIQDVADRTNGQVRLGTSTVYAALKRLLAAGILTETDRPRAEQSDDARRRYYRATPLGHRVAREAAREIDTLHAQLRAARLIQQKATRRSAP